MAWTFGKDMILFTAASICLALALWLVFELCQAIRFLKEGVKTRAKIISLNCQGSDGQGCAPTPTVEIDLPNGEKEIREVGFGSERFANSVGQSISVRYLPGIKYVLPDHAILLWVRPFLAASFLSVAFIAFLIAWT